MPEQFRRIMGPVLNKVKMQKGWCGEDPAFALAAIYLYFFTYFTVERLMQRGNQHLGISDSQAIERLINLLSHGLWRSATVSPKSRPKDKTPDLDVESRKERAPLPVIASGNGM